MTTNPTFGSTTLGSPRDPSFSEIVDLCLCIVARVRMLDVQWNVPVRYENIMIYEYDRSHVDVRNSE